MTEYKILMESICNRTGSIILEIGEGMVCGEDGIQKIFTGYPIDFYKVQYGYGRYPAGNRRPDIVRGWPDRTPEGGCLHT